MPDTIHWPNFITPEPDEEDTLTLNVIVEELTPEEAQTYANSLTPQEAREHLQVLMKDVIA